MIDGEVYGNQVDKRRTCEANFYVLTGVVHRVLRYFVKHLEHFCDASF